MTDYAEIGYEVVDGVATITLNRPQRLNAFTYRMCDELLHAFARIDADDGVRAVVVTGSGRAFCAGFDLDLGADSFDQSSPVRQRQAAGLGTIGFYPRDSGGAVVLRISACRKVVIAAVNGPAVGVGITITLPMDIRLAADDAKIGFVFARRGMVPDACASWYLPRAVGIQQAMEWVATGRVFPARDAAGSGLFLRTYPQAELLPAAYALARDIIANTSSVAVAASRQLLWQMLGEASPWEAHRLDSAAANQLGRGPDAVEGVTSFLEHRDPAFSALVSTGMPDLGPPWPQPPADVSRG